MAKIIPDEEKVFMVSKSTNTTYSGSAALKAMNEWYTMEDVSNTVKPYKVYTALLYQGGGSDPQSLSSGPVLKGVTYLIDGADEFSDFSNVGGPPIATGDGTFFIATNSNVPNEYGSANLSYDTGAPVADILENTLGFNPFFRYSSAGSYVSYNSGWYDFLLNSMPVQVFINCGNRPGDYIYSAKAGFSIEDGTLAVNSFNEGIPADDVLSDSDGFVKTSIEVRVYN